LRRQAKASTAGPTSGRGNGLGSIRSALLTALFATFALLVLAPTALAANHHFYVSSFGSPGTAEAKFGSSSPNGAALNQTTGDLYVADTANARIERFASDGTFISTFGWGVSDGSSAAQVCTSSCQAGIPGSGAGQFTSPTFVAVDNSGGASQGDLYVADTATNLIQKFDALGNLISSWGDGGTCPAAPNGQLSGACATDGPFSAFGASLAGIAVSSSSGDLWVYNTHAWMFEFAQDGTFTTDFSTTFGVTPVGIAVDSADNLYIARGTPYVEKVSDTGEDLATIDNCGCATGVAVDPATDQVYALHATEVVRFDSSGSTLEAGFGSPNITSGTGIAVRGSDSRAYVSDAGNTEVDVFDFGDPPVATTNPATTIHHTDAVLNGHLALAGDPSITDCHFEWGTTTSYGNSVPCNEGNSFNAPADVSANLSFLTPGTPIHFRLDITGSTSGFVPGNDQSFTPPLFPSVHPSIAVFGSDGTSATTFPVPTGLGFDQANRKLYVVNENPPSIYGFDASAPPDFTPLSGFHPLGLPNFVGTHPGIAVGSAGDVYLASQGRGVPDPELPAIVYGFSPTGASLGGNFPVDPALDPGAPSGGPEKNLCAAATDSAGNLWVANKSTNYILEYDSAGVFQSALDVSAHGSPCDLAFDSNDDLYVNQNGVWRYTAASAYTTATQVISSFGHAIAVDPSTHHLYLARFTAVDEYDSSGKLLGTFATDISGAQFEGVTVDATNHYAYISDAAFGANPKIRVFGPGVIQEFPTVTPGNPTAITGTSATLHAKVDPETFQVTDCRFEWGTDASYGHTAPCSPGPGSGSGDVAVSAPISGLNGGTTYHFRIVAANANGAAEGPDQTFITEGPAISAESVEDVSFSDATVSAKINPRGEATTYHVEYGTTSSYGQSTPESLPIGFPGDESAHTVSVHIGGLAPATAYHFRFVASNPTGTDKGSDAGFATYSAPPTLEPCPNDQLRSGAGARLPDCRAYEQATPVEKHGANAQGTINEVEASSAGDRVTFFLNGGLPTSDGSSELSPYMASRGAAGWSSAGLLPATDPGHSASVLGWSDELSTTVVGAPGPGNVGQALYLRDSATGAFQLAAGSPDALAGFAADTSHLIFETGASLLPEAPLGKQDNLYDLDHGALSLVGRIPAGSATSCDDAGGPACVPAPDGSFAGSYDTLNNNTSRGGAKQLYYTQNTISRDGSRVFFTAAGTGQLYVREGGTTTTQISASQRTVPDPGGERPAAFMAATPDGSEVFFLSCEKLTDDSTAVSTGENFCTKAGQGQDLYSYDTGSGQLTDLSVDSNVSDAKGAAVQGILGTSTDGSYVYFAAKGALAPGAPSGSCNGSGPSETCNLYLSHDGTTTFIAPLSGDDEADWAPRTYLGQKNSRVSADGRTLLFSSQRSLTGYDNTTSVDRVCVQHLCEELFRYTAPEEGLTCISCNPTGVPPNGAAELGALRSFLYDPLRTTLLSRNLSADGKRIFFDSPDALLPTDINGVTDVYEWEADGTGSCHTPGGCIYLISSGTSGELSYFADASANGDHAFFFTDQQLVPFDQDQLYDVYDAGVGAGLPSQHALAPPTCTSTACQANPGPPPEQTPASAAFSGPGNVHESAKARGCPKGKRKVRHAGKVRCQKAHKRHKRHNNRGGSK
jgi:hypothetical protein